MAPRTRWLAPLALLLACAAEAPTPTPEAPSEGTPTPLPVPLSDVSILSAYFGLETLPPRVSRICGARAFARAGMPVTFSAQLDADTIEPEDFAVEVADGSRVTPICTTLRPADEPLELRTVLLVGEFGSGETPPQRVEVVGRMATVEGVPVGGIGIEHITALEDGPSLLLAERFDPATPGLAGECPEGTAQVVQLTWEGGVTGPDGADLAPAQREAVSVTLADETVVTPIALADDDPDNIVHACLAATTPARSVEVAAGHFHDPRDDANPATSAAVVPGETP